MKNMNSALILIIICIPVIIIILIGISLVFYKETILGNGQKKKIAGFVFAIIVLLLFLLSLFSQDLFRKNLNRKISGEQINRYIRESTEIEDSLSIDLPNQKLGKQKKTIMLKYSETDTELYYYYDYVYYSKKYNKYFSLISFEGEDVFNRITEVKNIVLTVNKNIFNNSSYGTIDNPVPILRFMGKNESIRYDNQDFDKAYMNKRYVGNVTKYMKFILPEKDLENMSNLENTK